MLKYHKSLFLKMLVLFVLVPITVYKDMYHAKVAATIFTGNKFSTFIAFYYIIIHCIYIYLTYMFTLDLKEYYYLHIL